MTCITWLFLISKQFYQELQETYQTVAIKQTLYLQLYCLWPSDGSTGWCSLLFMVWGEGKEEVLLKWYIVLIAVLDGVAAFTNSSNIEINFYSSNCGGKKIKFIISAYPPAVTNVQKHSVTHKYLAVWHKKWGRQFHCLKETNIKSLWN